MSAGLQDVATKLSNSLSHIDVPEIRSQFERKVSRSSSESSIRRRGSILVVKAYLARFASEAEAIGDSQIDSMLGVFDSHDDSLHKPKRYRGKVSRYETRAAKRGNQSFIWKKPEEKDPGVDVAPWKFPSFIAYTDRDAMIQSSGRGTFFEQCAHYSRISR